jgi:PHD/YefM family antitoxin component YafN of YafNO toxin-antitoxin module
MPYPSPPSCLHADFITRHGVPAGILIGFEDPEAWWEELLRDPRFRDRLTQARGSLREGRSEIHKNTNRDYNNRDLCS